RVCDPDQKAYFEEEVQLRQNEGKTSFIAAGPLGVHYIYLIWPDSEKYSRYLNFLVDGRSSVETGDPDFDDLIPDTASAMLLGRREYDTPRGKSVAYISADTYHFDGIWLRDFIYGLPAYKHWEMDMKSVIDRFLEDQSPEGMIPDGIERDGSTWRVGLESDVEYLIVLAVWQTWQATGDDDWMEAALPKLEKALAYVQSDPRHWDENYRLIKRQHSCDTWDFDIDGASDSGTGRYVIAACDQSGYYLAFKAMSCMYRHIGADERAAFWTQEAEAYRLRAVSLLWDGTKFLHHVHLDNIEHGDFDETKQLAMGNTWAVTRGLAGSREGTLIVDEYRRRHRETGDAYPWWSLQPGYPDDLHYFESSSFLKQGGYANGGLMPWVGGELCRGAFMSGREEYGVELLRQYAGHLGSHKGAQVWYWPDGQAGFRTTNEVAYAGWGMAEWVNALMEGLSGIRDIDCLLQEVEVSPRWVAAGVADAYVVFRYAASRAYFAYRMQTDAGSKVVQLACSGSGQRVNFRVLLPEGWLPQFADGNGQPLDYHLDRVDRSNYVTFSTVIEGLLDIRIECLSSVDN
ncbi:MAG: hypothetical protein PHT33_15230, partial [bacterium]|nr:hypothetical protein [bacterium]